MPRALVILLGFAAFAIAMAGVREIANIVAPIFLALTLVITAHPLRGWLIRRRVPAWAATLAVLLTLYTLLIGLVVMLTYALAKLAIEMPAYSGKFERLYQGAADRLADAGIGSDQINQALDQFDYGSVFGYVQSVVSTVLSAGSLFILILTVFVFMMMDASSVPQRIASIDKTKPHLAQSLRAFAHNIRSYWLVTTAFGAIVAFLDGIALWIIGVPLTFTWALLSFITNYIPNIGFVLGLIPPALLAYLDGGWAPAIAVVAVYCVLNFVIQTILQPRITGDAVGVSTMVAFVSLLFWSFVLGPLGALIAVPTTLFVKAILIDADPSAKWANALVSNKVDTR